MSTPLDALEEFPQPETHVSRAARVARERETAKERARRWREEQRSAAAVDAALIAGLARAFLPDGVDYVEGPVPLRGDAVPLKKVLDHAAKALRNGGGDYDEGKRLVGERLQVALTEILRRRRARAT
ncbi:hypothetical protein ASF60_21810 [Methylobacterium sp. Leaf113]|uniref:hypothetical protein n=1 Tax=Methylobacterium sp. Leaf113 TaxID=1736259 RepID=UPI0006F3528E|nr:hypothetical protein [Methylobacterium sp. Leaf113]KQP85328.1 hypothetical protein ASF60_21810 [Methylobacterium sp. Leaf113]